MEKKVNILLVEDELIVADYMKESLENLGYSVCDICINYDEAVAALYKQKPDLAIIDITLKGNKTGIELGKFIKENLNIPFIFASSHSDKSTIDKAKQVLPYAYLIKPFGEEDLYAVIETALMHFGRKHTQENEQDELPTIINNAVFIKHRNKFVKLAFDDLLYIEADDNYVHLIGNNVKYTLRSTLKSITDTLPNYFWRIHRSYVINLHKISSFSAEEVFLGNQHLPIGKSFQPMLLDKIKILNG
jgi:two-component system, LytTR family, response regulator LytT